MKNIDVEIHNEFDIIITNSETGNVVTKAKAFNIILNSFWTRFISSQNGTQLSYIHFGSGTATPLPTDTALTNRVGSLATTTVSVDKSTFRVDGVTKIKKTIRLNAGVYTGATLSEVGFAGYPTAELNTKALIKDENGNPISYTIGPLDVIDIYGTFYSKTPINLGSSIYFDSPLPMSICGGIPGGTSYNGWYNNEIDQNAALVGDNADMSVWSPTVTYDIANKKFIISFPNVVAGSGNGVGGYRSLHYSTLWAKIPCVGFTQSPIIKEVIGVGDGVKKDFTCVFSRILDNGTAKLYVNDLEVSATFDYEIPKIMNTNSAEKMRSLLKYVSTNKTFGRTPVILENPYRSKFGLSSSSSYKNYTIECSEDLVTWTTIGTSNAVSIPLAYQKYRYWRVTQDGSEPNFYGFIFTPSFATYCPIHADIAPESGATIALTYQPDCLAKDDKHILNNVKIEISFNEYTPT